MSKKDTTEVVLRFKNVHYSDDISGGDSIHTPSKNSAQDDNDLVESRPISCPVCNKITALTSVLIHFYFDHSKVPKLKLSSTKRQHVAIKATDLSFETSCIAVLLLEGESLTGIKSNRVRSNKIRPCFLLASKLRIGTSKSDSNVSEKKNFEEKLGQNKLVQHKPFDQNYLLIFWTCKIDHCELIFHVKLSRMDKKISFSYTGEAIHIKEKQDGTNVYQHSQCLIIRGEAANDMLDKDDQMHVFVKCLL